MIFRLNHAVKRPAVFGGWTVVFEMAATLTYIDGYDDHPMWVLDSATRNPAGFVDDRPPDPDRIRAGAAAIVAATDGRDPAEPCRVPWFGADTRLRLGTVVGLFLSETLLHTLDVARASYQKWPLPPDTARLIVSPAFPELMPRAVNRDQVAKMGHAAVRLHIRGGVTLGIDTNGSGVEVERDPVGGHVDCHVFMDPVGFLLSASGRTSQNRQIAAGRMLPYGRKPWLAPKVAKLFFHP